MFKILTKSPLTRLMLIGIFMAGTGAWIPLDSVLSFESHLVRNDASQVAYVTDEDLASDDPLEDEVISWVDLGDCWNIFLTESKFDPTFRKIIHFNTLQRFQLVRIHPINGPPGSLSILAAA